jgi:hypothetical protein
MLLLSPQNGVACQEGLSPPDKRSLANKNGLYRYVVTFAVIVTDSQDGKPSSGRNG